MWPSSWDSQRTLETVGEEVAAIVLFCLKAVDHVFLPAVRKEELGGRSLDFLSHVLIAVGLPDAGDDDLVVPRPVDALHDYGKAGGNKRGRGLRLQRREQCRPRRLAKARQPPRCHAAPGGTW